MKENKTKYCKPLLEVCNYGRQVGDVLGNSEVEEFGTTWNESPWAEPAEEDL